MLGVQLNTATVFSTFSRRHPLASWVASMLLCFAGEIFSVSLVGDSPLAHLTTCGNCLLSATCVWSVSTAAKGAITSNIKHAIKLKTSPARLAQLLQPSLAFCFSLQPMTAHRAVRRHWLQKLKQNANEWQKLTYKLLANIQTKLFLARLASC